MPLFLERESRLCASLMRLTSIRIQSLRGGMESLSRAVVLVRRGRGVVSYLQGSGWIPRRSGEPRSHTNEDDAERDGLM